MEKIPQNFKTFPKNVWEPRQVQTSEENYTLFGFHFKGIQDFYDFLKKEPRINKEVWGGGLESINNDADFAGEPYESAVEKLVREMDPGYQEYLQIQKNIHAKAAKVHEYQLIKSVAGGMVNPVDYTTGSPTIYRSSRLITKPKFLTIDTQVAYLSHTSKSQVFNRAIIITNLIRALERKGYNVDVNSFMLAYKDDELIQAIFQIKQHGERTNYQSLYKSLVDVEFFRRLCFRLMEVSDVENDWSWGYGRTAEESLAREVLKLKKDDIYFDQPSEMGIYGHDIGDDFENAIEHLGLEKIIDVPREKEILEECVKVLRK